MALPFLLLLLVVGVRAQNNVSVALSAWQPGIASLYGGDFDSPHAKDFGASIGSCGYADIPVATWPFLSIAALPTTGQGYLAGPAQGCGTCYQVTCVDDGPQFNGKCLPGSAGQSVTVQVTDVVFCCPWACLSAFQLMLTARRFAQMVDSCPECQANQFDIQAQTFGRVAPEANGRMAMQYRRVTCTPDGNIRVRVDGNYPGIQSSHRVRTTSRTSVPWNDLNHLTSWVNRVTMLSL